MPKKIKVDEFVTYNLSFDQIKEVFEACRKEHSNCCKALNSAEKTHPSLYLSPVVRLAQLDKQREALPGSQPLKLSLLPLLE